ncbi:MAG: hypothetical protein JSU95_13425 [Betaproteobacteria bacterium]|nr:MAG: hypothetical protein JSU95_13425 [Betaproteobacteria bacterium]
MERNKVPSIWWVWLVVASVLTMLYSLSFVLLPDISLSSTSDVYLGSPDAYQAFGDDGAAYLRFILGVSGAISVAWMTLILLVVLVPFRRGERWAWQAVTASILIWFLFDSGHSIASGFSANAIYNLLILILFAIPLGASYRCFQRR